MAASPEAPEWTCPREECRHVNREGPMCSADGCWYKVPDREYRRKLRNEGRRDGQRLTLTLLDGRSTNGPLWLATVLLAIVLVLSVVPGAAGSTYLLDDPANTYWPPACPTVTHLDPAPGHGSGQGCSSSIHQIVVVHVRSRGLLRGHGDSTLRNNLYVSMQRTGRRTVGVSLAGSGADPVQHGRLQHSATGPAWVLTLGTSRPIPFRTATLSRATGRVTLTIPNGGRTMAWQFDQAHSMRVAQLLGPLSAAPPAAQWIILLLLIAGAFGFATRATWRMAIRFAIVVAVTLPFADLTRTWVSALAGRTFGAPNVQVRTGLLLCLAVVLATGLTPFIVAGIGERFTDWLDEQVDWQSGVGVILVARVGTALLVGVSGILVARLLDQVLGMVFLGL